jgi:hypothetical protein
MIKPFKTEVNPKQSKLIQRLLFQLDIFWINDNKEVSYIDSPFLGVTLYEGKFSLYRKVSAKGFKDISDPKREAKNVIRNLKAAVAKKNHFIEFPSGRIYSKSLVLKSVKDIKKLCEEYAGTDFGEIKHPSQSVLYKEKLCDDCSEKLKNLVTEMLRRLDVSNYVDSAEHLYDAIKVIKRKIRDNKLSESDLHDFLWGLKSNEVNDFDGIVKECIGKIKDYFNQKAEIEFYEQISVKFYSKKELRPLFLKLCHDTADYIDRINKGGEETDFNIDSWIEKNL